jgi:penicillin-binding protein 2
VSFPTRLLLLAALSLSSAYAVDGPVPKALPVEPAPVAEPVVPAPRASPVLPGDPETLLPHQKQPRALPVVPNPPKAEPAPPEKIDPVPNVLDSEEAEQSGPVQRALPVTKEGDKKKGAFKPPPLRSAAKRDPAEGEKPATPIGAAWETRTEARTLILKVPAPRGQIVDRDGRPMAQNKIGKLLALMLPYLEGATDERVVAYANERIRYASACLGESWTLEPASVLSHYQNRRWLPLPFSSMLTEEQVVVMEAKLKPGLEIFSTYQRFYPGGGTACHIVGYVGKMARVPTGPVVSGEPMWAITEGREGLEVTFDEHLQGTPGSVNYIFGTDGAKLAEEMVRQPVPGRNVVTSIDLEMQELAEQHLADFTKCGAFVIMDVRTGDIYAMASRPTYDINTWIPAISSDEFKALQEDPDLPLFPRAFRGQYPPASTFKVSVALAALESGAVDGETLINCPTSVRIGDTTFRNWNKKPEGKLSVMGALMRSCNTWFYVVGRQTGGDNVSSMAYRLGYGSKTGIPLNAEAGGFMPTDAILKKRYGYGLSYGYLANVSIGQGSVLTTPLQVAQMMAAVGNGYAVPKPRLVLQVQDMNNNVIESFPPIERNALNLKPENIGLVRQGLIDVVNAGAGTAKSARNDYVTMAGKTGTGQWIQNGEKLYLSWFAGYLPAEDPKYAFAAVCEGEPGEYITGGRKSAPMVGKYFNALYKLKSERGELGDYVKTAVASEHTVPQVDTSVADPNAGQPVTTEPPKRRGIFGFGRRPRR